MKSNIFNFLQSKMSIVILCAVSLTCTTTVFAQDNLSGDEATTVKTPKRKTAADKNPTVSVQGVVLDQATKKPIAGVRLQTLSDERYAAMTDAEGKFTIKVPTFATALYVQAPNYIAQQVAIRANDPEQKVSVLMLSDAFAPMYENATEYTAKRSFTSNGKGLSVDEEVSAKLGADIRTIMHSGSLEQGASMFIRGINSINATSQPMVILDGVELDMMRNRSSLHQGDIFNMLSTISPEDIDKVTVLKNATALYGARGANGVIIIDTKRGHSMATRIDAKISTGWTMIPNTPTLMNADQYRTYAVEQLSTIPAVQEAQKSSSTMMDFKFLNDTPNPHYLAGYKTYHNDTDWKDYILKNAFTQNYSINVQGGDDIGMYNLSVAYTQTDKNVKTTDFDRISVRFNTDINLLHNLTTKFDMSFSKTTSSLLDDGIAADLTASPITSPLFLSYVKSPLLYPYQYNDNIHGFTSLLCEEDDLFASAGSEYSLSNPVALLENAEGDRKNRNENTFFNVAVAPTYEINKHLSFTTHFSYYINRNSQAYYRPNLGMSSFYIESLGTVYSKVASIFNKETNIISNTHLDWNNKFGAHNIALTGGFRYNYFAYDGSDLKTEYQVKNQDDKNPQLAIGTSYYSSIAGVDDVWKNMQWYANADYSYKNRYFLTLSLLAEANSRFGINASDAVKAFGVNWAIFPSAQLGYVISNENWFPKNTGVNYLRLSAGFDMSGNDDISNYATATSFSAVRFNSTQIGFQLTNVGNDEVKWETTKKWNIGLQTYLWHNRLGIDLNVFIHDTDNLLSLKSFDNPIGGINNYWVNSGNVRNTGYELGLNLKPIATKNWHMEIGATVGHYNNKVRSLADGSFTSSVYGTDNIITSEDNPVGLFYGYQTHCIASSAGCGHVFSTSEEAASAGKLHTNSNGQETTNLYFIDNTGAKVDFEAGDVWFVDQNNDGCIDENDKVVIGDPNPDIYGNIYGSLAWKRLRLGFTFNYCVGNDVFNYQRSILNSGSTLYNQQIAEIGRWRYEGQFTNLPRVAYGDPKGNNRFSDRWIEDGSYLRLKTLTLSYNVPLPEAWQSWLQGISVWGEIRNLFTITRYTGDDPEFSINNSHFYQGIDCGNIAQSRQFVVGVNINL